MTSSPKLFATGSLTSWTYANDILGNRTTRNQYTGLGNPIQLMEWDKLGRMTRMASGTNSSSNGSTYTYRADGQRLSKVGGPYVYGLVLSPGGPAYYQINTGTATPVERYYYDGTMGFEDSTTASGTTKVSRYGLGARGIDRIEYYDGSSTTYGYPLYDGHGNMRATLAKNGSGGYSTGNWRTYDVWGSVRDGSATGDPKQRYCAGLGHVADDETGLTYMRSRYYEPSTGRFVSQDHAMQSSNWYRYCLNDPINFLDESGTLAGKALTMFIIALCLLVIGVITDLLSDLGNANNKAFAQWAGIACEALSMTLFVYTISEAVNADQMAPVVGTYLSIGLTILTLALCLCVLHDINIWLELLKDEGWTGSPPILNHQGYHNLMGNPND